MLYGDTTNNVDTRVIMPPVVVFCFDFLSFLPYKPESVVKPFHIELDTSQCYNSKSK